MQALLLKLSLTPGGRGRASRRGRPDGLHVIQDRETGDVRRARAGGARTKVREFRQSLGRWCRFLSLAGPRLDRRMLLMGVVCVRKEWLTCKYSKRSF